ncbi:hypothetical protein LCGC14_2828150 [marine sediment metagenome]|uniref:Disaggregatase-related domain-containing protein n=1 Tax=marine sediment metagenome TaxID=412755 RepID=A0A0F8YEX2_9ZZZZ
MPTLIAQPDGAAGNDTRLDFTNPNMNYETADSFFVGDGSGGANDASRPVIKFNLSSIPSDATIDSVTLELWENFADRSAAQAAAPVNLHRLLQNWVEAQVTWNDYSTGNSWGTAGAASVGVDRDGDVSATVTLDHVAAGAMVTWADDGADPSLKNDVQQFVNGTWANYGWILEKPDWELLGVGPFALNQFRTSDYATAAQRPKLTVNYTLAAGVITERGPFRGINRGIQRGVA